MTVFRPIVFILLLCAGTASAAPLRYDMDSNHTQVTFSWSHFGFSHPSGRLKIGESTLQFDAVDPARSSVVVNIPIAGMDTGVPALDEHLKGPEFFDAARFPIATFTSNRVVRAGAQGLTVYGTLSLHGVTKPVVLDVTVNKIGTYPMGGRAAVGFDAHATIQRSDFGIANYVPNVGDTITISISTEALVPKPSGD